MGLKTPPVATWAWTLVHFRILRLTMDMKLTQSAFQPFLARLRRMAAALAVVAAVIAAVFVWRGSSSNLERLHLIDVRLQETGRYSEVRRRIQRSALQAVPGSLSPQDAIISDLRIQLQQAERLGERLPVSARTQLSRVRKALEGPVVYRQDLLAAAAILEAVLDAEAAVQEDIFVDARAAIVRERALTLAALLGFSAFAVAALWVLPARLITPLRMELQTSTRRLLERERALTRAQQLSQLGERAADLAHEVRNPVAGVIMGLHNLSGEMPSLQERLHPMVNELERATRTLGGYLSGVHSTAEAAVETNPGRLIRELGELLALQAPAGVTVEAGASGGSAMLPRDSVQQILLNLGLNSLQAMERSGGVLRLNVNLDGNDLSFEVKDEGAGFPAHVLAGEWRRFESTRPGGSGLGLSIANRLAKGIGAELRLANRPEGGSIARLLFRNMKRSE